MFLLDTHMDVVVGSWRRRLETVILKYFSFEVEEFWD